MKLLKLLLSIYLLSAMSAFAQQDPQFSQYMFNKLYYNPASAGVSSEYLDATVLYRSQWTGYDGSFDDGGAPTTQLFSLAGPIPSKKIGLGIHFINDQLGPQTNQEIQLSLSYYLNVGKGKLSYGIRGGSYFRSINYDELRFVDPNDPIRGSGTRQESAIDFAAGMYYDARWGYIGVSANHLSEPEFSGSGSGEFSSLVRHLSLMGGINFYVSNNLILKPSVIVKSDLATYSIEGSILAVLSENVELGLTARELESLVILTGLNLTKEKRLRLGYAFDYTLNNTDAKAQTSHELMLTYRFLAPGTSKPKAIRTPRFRHE